MSAKGDVKRIYNVITDNETGESALVMAHNINVSYSTHLFYTLRKNRQTSTYGIHVLELLFFRSRLRKRQF